MSMVFDADPNDRERLQAIKARQDKEPVTRAELRLVKKRLKRLEKTLKVAAVIEEDSDS